MVEFTDPELGVTIATAVGSLEGESEAWCQTVIAKEAEDAFKVLYEAFTQQLVSMTPSAAMRLLQMRPARNVVNGSDCIVFHNIGDEMVPLVMKRNHLLCANPLCSMLLPSRGSVGIGSSSTSCQVCDERFCSKPCEQLAKHVACGAQQVLRQQQKQCVEVWLTKLKHGIQRIQAGTPTEDDEPEEKILPCDQVKAPTEQFLLRLERDISFVERIAAMIQAN